MKFEYQQLYGFSKIEGQNIALFAVFLSRTHDCMCNISLHIPTSLHDPKLKFLPASRLLVECPKILRTKFEILF